jgi:hypothetical protein
MKIMNTNYVKGFEMEKKFHNRNQKDLLKDEEYAKYKDDVENSMKMSTILCTLNSPKRKRIAEKMAQNQKTENARLSQARKTASSRFINSSLAKGQSGTPFSGIRPL